MSEPSDQGIIITKELLKKLHAARGPEEITAIAQEEGVTLDSANSAYWYEKLHQNELARKNESCCTQHCPRCNSTDYYRRYLSTGLGTGNVIEHCNSCGLDRTYV